MKTIIILSEQRSGSTYLSSLITASGKFGKCEESVSSFIKNIKQVGLCNYDEFRKSLTVCKNYSFKVFPAHLLAAEKKGCNDLILETIKHSDAHIFRLIRNDKLAQAVSISIAQQTRSWTSRQSKKKEPKYDKDDIAACLFRVYLSEAFWDAYIFANKLNVKTLSYEELMSKGLPDELVDLIGVDIVDSELYVQRNELSEDFKERFLKDCRKDGVIKGIRFKSPPRTIGNLMSFLKKSLMPSIFESK